MSDIRSVEIVNKHRHPERSAASKALIIGKRFIRRAVEGAASGLVRSWQVQTLRCHEQRSAADKFSVDSQVQHGAESSFDTPPGDVQSKKLNFSRGGNSGGASSQRTAINNPVVDNEMGHSTPRPLHSGEETHVSTGRSAAHDMFGSVLMNSEEDRMPLLRLRARERRYIYPTF